MLILLGATLCLITGIFPTQALAQDPPLTTGFTEFKMVNSNDPQQSGSRIEKHTFLFSETPFLYMQISPALNASIRSYWTGPDTKLRTRTKTITTSSGTEFWFSLLHWDKDRQLGPWDVKGQLWDGTTLLNKSETSFVVTPEPSAIMLYGLGGLGLLGRLPWRNRKTG